MRNKGKVDAGELRAYVAEFYPEYDPYAVKILDEQGAEMINVREIAAEGSFTLKWTKEFSNKTKFLCELDNLLYEYPLYANLLFLAIYGINIFGVVILPWIKGL